MRSGLKATGHSHNTKEHENLSLQSVGVAKQPCRKNAFRNLATFLWRRQITSGLVLNFRQGVGRAPWQSCDWEWVAFQYAMSENISLHSDWCSNGDAIRGFVGGKSLICFQWSSSSHNCLTVLLSSWIINAIHWYFRKRCQDRNISLREEIKAS